MLYRHLLLAALSLVLSQTSSAFAQTKTDPSLKGYDGAMKENFAAIKEGYSLGEWSTPEKIEFFQASDGHRLRYAHWRAQNSPPRGTVVHFNGRTEFIERNAHIYKELAERGWNVWTLDWRGQGLSYRMQLPGDVKGEPGHIDSFETYVNDARQFMEKVQFEGLKKILIGHSMGGQIALRYMIEYPDSFDQVLLSSPLVRLPRGPISDAVQYVKDKFREFPVVVNNCVISKPAEWEGSFTGSACAELKAPGSVQVKDKKRTNGYTHDERKLAISECLVEESRAVGKDLGLAVGCPTGGWLVAARESTDTVFAESGKLSKPILIVAANNDPAVDPKGQQELCGKIRNLCTLVQIPDAGHELMIETSEIRGAFLTCFDVFAKDPVGGPRECEAAVRSKWP